MKALNSYVRVPLIIDWITTRMMSQDGDLLHGAPLSPPKTSHHACLSMGGPFIGELLCWPWRTGIRMAVSGKLRISRPTVPRIVALGGLTSKDSTMTCSSTLRIITQAFCVRIGITRTSKLPLIVCHKKPQKRCKPPGFKSFIQPTSLFRGESWYSAGPSTSRSSPGSGFRHRYDILEEAFENFCHKR